MIRALHGRARRALSFQRFFVLAMVVVIEMVAVDSAPIVSTSLTPGQPGFDAVPAAYCGTAPSFTGRLTGSATSTTAVTRTKTGTVYPYISNVVTPWSCTAYFRYSGVTWNTAASTGSFAWGNLINSTSVACNWVVGSTDYLKGNGTTDCPDTDAEYAMSATLPGGTYQADVAHDGTGDFSYVHADCATYYGGTSTKTGQTFSPTNTGNRPGTTNCDQIALDGTGTTQSIVVDGTNPTVAITAPAAGGPAFRNTTAAYGVTFNPSDNLAGFGGSYLWTLNRDIAPIGATPGTCGAFTADPAGNTVTNSTQGSQTNNQTLAAASCYRWRLAATDQNGNGPVTTTSGSLLVDTVAPTTLFATPVVGTTVVVTGSSYVVAWSETDIHSGISTRSLQRRIATWSGSACGAYANDGSAVTTASPVTASSLVSGKCYQWIQTLTDRAGNSASATSGTVRPEPLSPSANFSTPDEGTLTIQSGTGYSVAWSETAGSGSITARSLQRQSGAIVTSGTCAGVTWANDGAADTNVSPRSQTLTANCYRWIQTLTNSAGKSGASTSGQVLVDPTAPSGALAYPEANRPLSGTVTITGTATDAGSFKDYILDYGVGPAPSSWTTIVTGTGQVPTTNTLGTWSTAGLNGVYTVRLTVRDNASNTMTPIQKTVYVENEGRGEEPFLSRVPFDLGGDWTLDVGVANGEARLSRDLFSIPSYGPPQELGLSYSSLEASTTGKFGVGWVSNLTQYLTFDAASYAGQTSIVWHRADGGVVPFGLVGGTWAPLAGHFETLSHSGTETTITLKDQSRFVFEDASLGRLKRIENRFGKKLTLVWNTSTATATDASGRVTNVTIDSANGRISAVADSAGRAWGFGYTGTGASSDLTSVTDPASKVTTLGYDASHHLTTVSRQRTPASGPAETILWTVGYTSGKVTSVLDPIGDALAGDPAHTFTYNVGNTVAGLLKDYSPLTRNSTTYAYDHLGRVTTETDPNGWTTTRAFNTDSTLASLIVPIDDVTTATTTYQYDVAGNLTLETAPIDAATSVTTAYSYNATNDLLTRSDADNDSTIKLVTKNTYTSGHLTSVDVNCTTSGTTPPAIASTCTGAGTQDATTNLITNYAYTANDQLEFEQDPLGRVTKHIYDASGNETSVNRNCTTSGTVPPSPWNTCTGGGTADNQTNVVSSSAFNLATTAGKAGLPTSQTDPLGNVTTLTYDALGRQLTEVLPGDAGGLDTVPSLTRTTTYDELGNLLTEAESWTPLGGGTPVIRTTTRIFDLRNREISVTDPAGVLGLSVYDAAGDTTSSTSAGVTTLRTFDGTGNALTETTDGTVTTHAYDARGQELTTQDPQLVTTSRTYDRAGRTLTDGVDDGTIVETTSHVYDQLGREVKATDPTGQISRTGFDRAGRSCRSVAASTQSDAQWAALANVCTSTIPDPSTKSGYDRNGNTVATTSATGILTTTTYDPLDRATVSIANDVASPTLPTEDVTTTTYYDARGGTIAVRDAKGVTLRTILNVRDLARITIADCTDSGSTPTTNPPACTGAPSPPAGTNIKTTYTYDGSGAVVLAIVASGTSDQAQIETALDGSGRTQAVKDALGTVTRTLYDGNGRATATIVNCTEDTSNPAPPVTNWASCDGSTINDGTWNVTTTRAYDSRGNQIQETAPNGRVTTSIFDGSDRLTSRIENDIPGAGDGNPPLVLDNDTFTAADGTLLSTYTGDSAKTWSDIFGTPQITGNRVTTTTAGSNARMNGAGAANVDARLTVNLGADGVSRGASIRFRYTDTNNFLFLKVRRASTGTNQIEFWKRDTGVTTNIGSLTMNSSDLVASTDYVLRVVANGSILTGYLNDLQKLQVSSSFNTAATGVGLAFEESLATGESLDSIELWSIGTAPAATKLDWDTYTDTTGTLLSAHTGDSGRTWTNIFGNPQVTANQVTATTAGSNGRMNGAGIGDVDVRLTVNLGADGVARGNSIRFRYLDSSNYLFLKLRRGSTGTNQIEFWKKEAGATSLIGSTVTLASGDLAANTDYALRVVAKGDSLFGFLGGLLRIQRTSSFNQTATGVGIAFEETLATGQDIDTFEVWSLGIDPDEDVTTSYAYDDAGRQTAVRAPTLDGATYAVTRSVYDTQGRLTSVNRNCTNAGTDPPGVADWMTCTGAGSSTAADTNVVTANAYDSNGRLVAVTEPDPSAAVGSTAPVTKQYAYDNEDRLCRVVENATGSTNLATLANPCTDATQTAGTTTTNVSTRYTYDGAGNLASMIDASGHTTAYAYNANGLLTTTTDALSATLVYAYNDLGQKIRQENRSDPPMTSSVSWTYDAAGRIASRTFRDGNNVSVTTSSTYDDNGNRLTASDGTLTITASYDRLDRPLTIDDEDAGTTPDTTYTYGLTSPSWTDPTGSYLVSLDAFDRATSVDGPAIGAITTGYRSDGMVASQSAPNGNTTAFSYDGLGRETHRDTIGTGSVDRADIKLTYNRAGQILKEDRTITGDTTNGQSAYTYDPLERLTGVTTPASVTTAYAWDKVPNRTSVQVGAGTPVTTTYDNANRPTSDSAGGTYMSDADGRLTTAPTNRYEWDSLGRLTKVKNAAGTITLATYTYDPLDRLRIVDYGGSNRVRFRYVGLTTNAVQTIDDTTGSVLRNIGTGWTGERLLDWTGTNSNIRYFGVNAHHDTVWTADSTGAVSATLRYDPWGILTSSTGSSLPDFRFQGSWFDTATSLSWVVTRWYAPSLGRFISEDSLIGDPADPPSRHLYAYGAGEPIGRWDADGHEYEQPTRAERQYCDDWGNMVSCYAARLWARWAKVEVQRLFHSQGDRVPGNAFKHCIWAGGCALQLGAGTAKEITDAHENKRNGRFIDHPSPRSSQRYRDWWRKELPNRRMDLHNNGVGIALAGEIDFWAYHMSYHYYFMTSRARSLISNRCMAALGQGLLTYLEGSWRVWTHDID